jgi:ABC-type transport system involved in multi-copper enzyme maturation permease subunit
MTTAIIDPTPVQPIDVSTTPRIPLSRLVRVELRKLANTRSGKWLLIAIGVITLFVIGVFFLTAKQPDRTFFNFMAATNGAQGLLLPVLGILLITSEWTQRTALVSFTLMPVRSRLLLAKVLASLIAGVVAIALTVVVAALATLMGGADNAWAHVGIDDLGKFTILQVTGVLQGLAFGLLFLSSSAAIVSYFVLPTALNLLSMWWKPLHTVQPWIDLWTSQQPLFKGGDITGEQWSQIATSTVLWVMLPFVSGLVRVLRAEVK